MSKEMTREEAVKALTRLRSTSVAALTMGACRSEYHSQRSQALSYALEAIARLEGLEK